MSGLADFSDRIRQVLGWTRDEAERELDRRVYALPLIDLTDPYFDDFQGDDCRCMGGYLVGAAPGNYSEIQLWNPTGSGKDLVVESVRYFVTAAGNIEMRAATAALTTLSGLRGRRDYRSSRGIVGEVRGQQVGVQSGVQRNQVYAVANTPLDYPSFGRFNVILAPGTSLIVSPTVPNITHQCSFLWQERAPTRWTRG